MDCNKFRTGKFLSHLADDQYTVIERNDTFQIETDKLTGHVLKARIKWISECEYELRNIEETLGATDTLKRVWQDRVVSTKIIEVKNTYCIYESYISGVSMRITDTLHILK
jgi:hypothetical protein